MCNPSQGFYQSQIQKDKDKTPDNTKSGIRTPEQEAKRMDGSVK